MARASSTTADEVALLRAVAQGERRSVEALFHGYSNRLLRYVYRRVGGRLEDAEEITQDTFLSALRMAHTFRGDASAFVWLCAIANLRIKDFFRKQNRERRIPERMTTSLFGTPSHEGPVLTDGGAQARSVLDRLECAVLMEQIMEGLSDDEREALLLRYVEGLSVREIGYLLKRSEKAVESLLIRAKKKPRDNVRKWLLEGSEVAQ